MTNPETVFTTEQNSQQEKGMWGPAFRKELVGVSFQRFMNNPRLAARKSDTSFSNWGRSRNGKLYRVDSRLDR